LSKKAKAFFTSKPLQLKLMSADKTRSLPKSEAPEMDVVLFDSQKIILDRKGLSQTNSLFGTFISYEENVL
jgi:hypothetical protein